jgi:hypothetical protein
MTPEKLELLRPSDGARYRRVTLAIERDGAITLHEHEMGAANDDVWGVDDRELTLSIPPDQVGRLALVLASEMLKGERQAARRLTEICEANELDCKIACWS